MEQRNLPASRPEHGQDQAEPAVPVDTARIAAVAERARSAGGDYSHPPRRRRIVLPVLLFLATCASTFFAGATHFRPDAYLGYEQAAWAVSSSWQQGLTYMVAVLAILLTHEMGHFLMALRHKIPASLPFFIPVPILPFGTMGAVIGMKGSEANRRQMFDLGVAGPLAGLAVALPIIYFGIRQLDAQPHAIRGMPLENPLVFRFLIDYLRPDLVSSSVYMSPLIIAGWVGLLVTGINMVPISQLDGGHVAYALLGRRAHVLARGLVVSAIISILVWEAYMWVVMLTLVILMGVDHPPMVEDRVPLGWPRRLIGYASLTIPILCFPPIRVS
ncbi:MAG: site-2 protease family protein [Pirellulales bacterium]|nr:site-2 protease family protein [Pirellulales bacterium]